MEPVFKRNSRAKRLRIAVKPDGQVVITAPIGMPLGFINAFVKAKAGWIKEKVTYFAQFPDISLLHRGGKRDYQKHKEEARILVLSRLEYFNQFYHFAWKRVSIKNQQTRWGSCSKNQNLNFNYKILFLPPELQDYIIVHELCHLKELNHSKNFWQLVARQIPAWRSLRQRLRQNLA